jgi:hypothetical protein
MMKSITSAIPPSVIQIFLLLSKDDPSSLFKPPLVDGETMALEAVGAACPHGCVLYGREMAPQAVAVGDLLTLSRYGNAGGIGSKGFMVEVVEACLGLVGDLTDDVRVGEMTFNAGKLLVVGNLPSAEDVVHAVAGAAYLGTARGMISADEHGDKDRAGNDAGGKEFLRGQADKVFPVHVRIPCSFWIGYKMETPRNVLNIKGNEMKSSRN